MTSHCHSVQVGYGSSYNTRTTQVGYIWLLLQHKIKHKLNMAPPTTQEHTSWIYMAPPTTQDQAQVRIWFLLQPKNNTSWIYGSSYNTRTTQVGYIWLLLQHKIKHKLNMAPPTTHEHKITRDFAER